MSRLPNPGSDNNVWGDILNDFLRRIHNADGTLGTGVVGGSQLQNGSVDGSKIATNAVNATHVADGALPQVKIQNLASDLAGKLTSAQLGVAGGIATLDGSGKLAQNLDAAKVASGVLDITRIPDLGSLYATLVAADGSSVQLKLLSNPDGSVTAIPLSAAPPATPANFATDIHLSFVRLSWNASADATSYKVYRDNALLGTVTDLTYVDVNVQVNQTYQYYLVAVNQYGMLSQPTATLPAFINPALNVAPTIDSITIWPTNPAPGQEAYVHVNASDVDGQQLAITLGIDNGTLSSTTDPSTWIWRP